MAGESTFDVVSKVDKQEVANALNQAQKEIVQRYDFKGVGAEVDFSGEKILMKANSEERVLAVLWTCCSPSSSAAASLLKSLDTGEPYASGKEFRLEASIKEGIAQDLAKKINKSSTRARSRTRRRRVRHRPARPQELLPGQLHYADNDGQLQQLPARHHRGGSSACSQEVYDQVALASSSA